MRSWVLNLDAEGELEAGRRYSPSARVLASAEAMAERFARALPEADLVIAPTVFSREFPRRAIDGFGVGRAFCPTPRALAALAAAGVALPDAPSFDVLRTVNERGFAHALAEGELPGAMRATDLDAVLVRLAARGPTGEWLLKRGFGQAGRGQRPIRAGAVSEADRAWIAASLRRGALYVEPRLPIVREYSMHGWAGSRASVRSLREQRVVGRTFVESVPAVGLDAAIERTLGDVAMRVAEALGAAGYFGPFGVDAFLYRTPSDAVALRALSEINARFCMGWDAVDGWDPPS